LILASAPPARQTRHTRHGEIEKNSHELTRILGQDNRIDRKIKSQFPATEIVMAKITLQITSFHYTIIAKSILFAGWNRRGKKVPTPFNSPDLRCYTEII